MSVNIKNGGGGGGVIFSGGSSRWSDFITGAELCVCEGRYNEEYSFIGIEYQILVESCCNFFITDV